MSSQQSTRRRLIRRPMLAAVAVAATAGLALAGCSGSPETPPAETPGGLPTSVTVGAISYVTGTYATFGAQMNQGIKVAEKVINDEKLLFDGASFTVDIQDDSSDPTQSLSLTRQFASDSKIPAIIGPIGTPTFNAVNPVADDLKIPIVSVGSATPFAHDDISQWITRVNLAGTESLITSYLKFSAEKFGTKRVSVIYDQKNAASVSDKDNVVKTVSAAGVELAGDAQAYTTGDTDFGTQIEAMLRANPDTIFVADGGPAYAAIMQQARARGFQGQFIGGTGLNTTSTAEQAPEATEGYLTFVPMDITSSDPVVQKFVAAFKALYPNDPIVPYAGWAYDSTMLLADAMNRAGSTDRTAVKEALGKTQGFKGVTGTYTFDGWGDNTNPTAYVAQLQSDLTLKVIGQIG